MKLIRTAFLMGTAAVALSGCAALSLVTKATDASEEFDRVNALADTTPTNMPTSGSAVYEGNAVLGADVGSNRNVAFVGDAELTASFTAAGGTVVGTLSDFSGLELTDTQVTRFENGTLDPNEFIAAASNARGTVAVNSVSAAGTTFVSSTSGTLRMNSRDYAVSGNLDGQFKGDNADSIKAVAATGFTIREDGVAATGATAEIAASQ